MGIHWQELIIILLIVLVLFGPRRLPEIGRSLGNGIREFKDSMSGKSAPSEAVNAHPPGAAEQGREAAAIPVEAATATEPHGDGAR